MPKATNIDEFLPGLLAEFSWHLNEAGCWAPVHVPPTLTNPILPMFRDRWATGPNQFTADIWAGLEAGLVLASRFLSEDWLLLWYTRLTFGERCPSTTVKGQTFLRRTEYTNTPAALAKVKENLAELGEVITFMWAPRSYKLKAWGMTYPQRIAVPFHAEFRDAGWPRTQDKYISHSYPHHCPIIVMNAYFMDYFRFKFATSPLATTYRVLFVFAITLAHEMAHAYWQWLRTHSPEPLWHQGERNNELGFSWERETIGWVIQPLKHPKDVCDGFTILVCHKSGRVKSSEHKKLLLQVLEDTLPADKRLTRRDAHGVHRTWPILEKSELRGSELFIDGPCERYIATIHCLPIAWIVAWFQEESWVAWRRVWDADGVHTPMTLNDAFLVVYDRHGKRADIWRSLNLKSGIDRGIMEELLKIDEREKRKQQEQTVGNLVAGFSAMNMGGR